MANTAFFTRDGDSYLPTDICRGPWDPKSLHGRVVAGLLAYEIEQRWIDPAFHPARLTVDLYRLPKFAPVQVTSKVVRDGNRIRIVDAEFINDGVSVGRASCVLLRRTDATDGNVWGPPDWSVPAPEALPEPEQAQPAMWDSRTIDHGFGAVAQKRTWIRENRPLIEGVELTPFLRAASSADFANPFANSGDKGLQYVNTDITLYLHRLPIAEWVGFEVVAHHSSEGIAVGECALYDAKGAFGRSSICGVAQRRKA